MAQNEIKRVGLGRPAQKERIMNDGDVRSRVLDIIESTYAHDEHGKRIQGDSPVSGADVVDMLLELGQDIEVDDSARIAAQARKLYEAKELERTGKRPPGKTNENELSITEESD